MGPQNYTLGNVIDPGLAFSGGLQMGEQRLMQQQQQALAMQQQRAAMAAQQERAAAIQAVLADPSERNFARLVSVDPKNHEAYKAAFAPMDQKRKQGVVADLLQWSAAIENGRPELAAQAMLDRADMLDRDAGGADPEAQALRAQAEVVKTNPELASRMYFMPMLYAAGDAAKGAISNLTAMREEGRKGAAAPAELRKKEADATGAEADAITKGVTAQYADRQAAAETATKEATAEYAKPLAAAELKQRAAQLGLTSAQTNQAIVTTKKLNAEIQQAALAATTGDPAKKFEFEKKLRDEFTTQAKEAILTQDAYKRMTASRKDAVGDIALIFGYMKMLDPTSVVREGEFATAQSAAGVPERILNLYNKAVEGKTVLPEGQRQKILAQARDLALKADEKVATVRKGLLPAVSAYKLDEKNIFSVGASVPPAPPPKPPASEPTATNPKTGEKLVLRGGKWVPL